MIPVTIPQEKKETGKQNSKKEVKKPQGREENARRG